MLSVFSTPDLLCRLQKGSLTRWWWGVVKESVQEYTANIHDSEKLIQDIKVKTKSQHSSIGFDIKFIFLESL